MSSSWEGRALSITSLEPHGFEPQEAAIKSFFATFVSLFTTFILFFPVGMLAQSPLPGLSLPHLGKRGPVTQLIVDGKPFLILGGEVHNSSSSSVEYMQPIWPRLAKMHLNTVLVPVAWETIEPQEGKFDFTNVDGLLKGARRNDLKLVLLWFGAWKNTYSSYVPAWVKTDEQRFPRVETSDGRGTGRLSPFSRAVLDADTRAFTALLRHLREVDSGNHTVLMVQIENEVGVIPESRDHSAVADAAFASPVPTTLMDYLKKHRETLNPQLRDAWQATGFRTSGTWQQIFGDTPLTDDFFMAWQYASYIDHVAAAGKAVYPLPFYANAALIRPNYLPGQYNSGGPLSHSMDIWKAAAPSIDMLSPDIYVNDFGLWADRYARPDNPLFIPETIGGAIGAADALYAFGHLSAIGFSPFGIDDPQNQPVDLAGIGAGDQRSGPSALSSTYADLEHLAPLVLDKQASGGIYAAVMEGFAQRSARLLIGDYIATVNRTGIAASSAGDRDAVLFIQTAPNEFLVVGAGDERITFTSDKPGPPTVGIESIDEMSFENGARVPGRRLNGDESLQGQALQISCRDLEQGRIYRIRLYRYR